MERVIFDTNAYRYLVANKDDRQIEKTLERLKASEKKNGIETLISPIVSKELLAHVADRNDPQFDKCLKAIKAQYLHNGTSKSYSMIASPELLLSKTYFNQTIPAKEETNKAIGQILFNLATNPSEQTFKKFQRNLNLNRDHVLDGENNFALTMLQFVMAVDPSAVGWRIFPNNPQKREDTLKSIRSEKVSLEIAMGYLFTTYQLLINSGLFTPFSKENLFEEITGRAKDFLTTFPEPIALYKYVMENLVNSEFNLLEKSRSNFLWDIHLMFNIGDHSIDGSKLYFVTADKAIIRTAIGENARYSILTFDEYLEYLK